MQKNAIRMSNNTWENEKMVVDIQNWSHMNFKIILYI